MRKDLNRNNTNRLSNNRNIWLDPDYILQRMKEAHGNRYDYSKVVIDFNQKLNQKVTIICPVHGEFQQSLRAHIQGRGCSKCIPRRTKLTVEDFIKRATKIHNGKYGYDRVKSIKNNKDKVEIYCKEGDHYFLQRVDGHLQGRKCPICYKKVKYTTEKFIELAKKVHGDKYDYSKVNYVDIDTPVIIICNKGHEFLQKPCIHLSGNGCSICAHHQPLTNEEFIERAKEIHGDRYDYSLVNYVNSNTLITVICKKHGPFKVLPFNHLRYVDCPKCAGGVPYTQEEYIELAKKVHGNKYNYDKVKYINSQSKIIVTCPIHGDFEIRAGSHVSQAIGCPICGESSLESEIRVLLENNNINFEYEKRFEWLGRMSLDFYLPDYNIGIECQGQQHFISVNFFGGEERFLENCKRDDEKLKLCNENNIKLLYFSKKSNVPENFNKYKIYFDKHELLSKIKNTVDNSQIN